MSEPLGLEGRASLVISCAATVLGLVVGGVGGWFLITEPPQAVVSEYLKPVLGAIIVGFLFGSIAVVAQSNRPAHDEPFFFMPQRRRSTK